MSEVLQGDIDFVGQLERCCKAPKDGPLHTATRPDGGDGDAGGGAKREEGPKKGK